MVNHACGCFFPRCRPLKPAKCCENQTEGRPIGRVSRVAAVAGKRPPPLRVAARTDIDVRMVGETEEVQQRMVGIGPALVAGIDFEAHDPMWNVGAMAHRDEALLGEQVLEEQLVVLPVERRTGRHDRPFDTVLLAVQECGLEQHGLDKASGRTADDSQTADLGQGTVAQPARQGDRLLDLERHVRVALDTQGAQGRSVQFGFRQQDDHAGVGVHRLGLPQLFGKFRHVACIGCVPDRHGLGQVLLGADDAHGECKALFLDGGRLLRARHVALGERAAEVVGGCGGGWHVAHNGFLLGDCFGSGHDCR